MISRASSRILLRCVSLLPRRSCILSGEMSNGPALWFSRRADASASGGEYADRLTLETSRLARCATLQQEVCTARSSSSVWNTVACRSILVCGGGGLRVAATAVILGLVYKCVIDHPAACFSGGAQRRPSARPAENQRPLRTRSLCPVKAPWRRRACGFGAVPRLLRGSRPQPAWMAPTQSGWSCHCQRASGAGDLLRSGDLIAATYVSRSAVIGSATRARANGHQRAQHAALETSSGSAGSSERSLCVWRHGPWYQLGKKRR